METSLKHGYVPAQHTDVSKKSAWKKLITWSAAQEKNKLLWAAISIAGHGTVFTIFTVMIILFTGNHFIFWPFAIGAMIMCLVVNLVGLPTKTTIPILLLSLIIDLLIIVICFATGFDFSAAYR